MIGDGLSFSFGIFFIEFLREFKTSNSVTAWLGSVFTSIPLIMAPVASSLVNRFGFRFTTIIGTIITFIGFFCCFFCTSLEMLFITYSIIPGLGLSLCFVSAMVSVAYHFDSKRSLATAISICGTGFGTFLFPPVIGYLIQEYTWRGTFLILSAAILNMISCGLLMPSKHPSEHSCDTDKVVGEDYQLTNRFEEHFKIGMHPVGKDKSISKLVVTVSNRQVDKDVNLRLLTCKSAHNNVRSCNVSMCSLFYGRRFVTGYCGVDATTSGLLQTKQNYDDSDHEIRSSSCPNIGCLNPPSATSLTHDIKSEPGRTAKALSIVVEDDDRPGCGDSSKTSPHCRMSATFVLFVVSNFVLYLVYDVPYVYMVDHAMRLGYEEEQSLLLISVTGATNIIGVLVFGYLGDKKSTNCLVLYVFCMLGAGASTLLAVRVTSLAALFLVWSSFALFIAANYTLAPIILLQMISLQEFSLSYGFLYDQTLSYSLTFTVSGCLMMLSGLLLYLVRVLPMLGFTASA